jgi:hypothetical protein
MWIRDPASPVQGRRPGFRPMPAQQADLRTCPIQGIGDGPPLGFSARLRLAR